MPDAPQAASQEQATPQTEAELRVEVLAAAHAGIAEAAGEPKTTDAGTGGAADTTPDSDGGNTPKVGDDTGDTDPADDEPPTDHTLFKAWVAEREAKLTTKLEADHAAKMENQKRSLLGDQRAQREREEREALLEELDNLSPEELADRVNGPKADKKAIQALADRERESGEVGVAAARDYALNEQVPLMFGAAEKITAAGGPNLVELFADPANVELIANHPHGMFGWLTDNALEFGGKHAVDEYKRSAEYKKTIEDAEERAVRDAFPNMRTPPAKDGTARLPATRTSTPAPDDDRGSTVHEVYERMGRAADPDVIRTVSASAPRRR